MALDATVNGASADSYVSVADADTYHTNHLYATDWTSASTANKEIALKMATRILDEKVDWVGLKTTEEQALRWGRSAVLDLDEFQVLTTVIPDAIKNATAEFARHLIGSNLTSNSDSKGLESLSVGSISLTFDKTDTASVLPDIVQEMLRGYGTIHARAKFGTVAVVRT